MYGWRPINMKSTQRKETDNKSNKLYISTVMKRIIATEANCVRREKRVV